MAALALGACSSAVAPTTTPTSALVVTSTTSPPTTVAPTTTTTTQPKVAHVGQAWTVTDASGDNVTVGLLAVIDPAQSPLPAGAGYRFMAVKITVTNNAAGAFTEDMNNDVLIVGSDDQTYTASMDPVNGCTNFDLGAVALSTGDSSVGCVAFQLPVDVKAAQMDFRFEVLNAVPVVWDL